MGNCQNLNSTVLLSHPAIGDVKVSEQGSNRYIDYSFEIQNSVLYEQWEKKLMGITYNLSRNNFLFLPIKKQISSPNQLCGSLPSVELRFEYCFDTVEDKIRKYRTSGEKFDEREIWYIIYALCKVARQFEKLGQKIGDITPLSVLYNEKKQVKIISRYSWPNFRDNLTKFQQEFDTSVFLAPEELNLLAGRLFETKMQSPNVSQVFSIGMLLLSCLTLENCHSLYDFDAYSLNSTKLEQLIKKAEERYSPKLMKTVRQMLSFESRKKLTELSLTLEKFESHILNRKFHQGHLSLTTQSVDESNLQTQRTRNFGNVFNISDISITERDSNPSGFQNRYTLTQYDYSSVRGPLD